MSRNENTDAEFLKKCYASMFGYLMDRQMSKGKEINGGIKWPVDAAFSLEKSAADAKIVFSFKENGNHLPVKKIDCSIPYNKGAEHAAKRYCRSLVYGCEGFASELPSMAELFGAEIAYSGKEFRMDRKVKGK